MEFVRGGLKAKGPAGNETWSGHASNEEKRKEKEPRGRDESNMRERKRER